MSSNLKKPVLSSDYKSSRHWDERFKCSLLQGDEETIKTINNKMHTNIDLNTLELDIFFNITPPKTDDTVHLEELARLLATHRKSPRAIHLLPATTHATCRLFLYSNQYKALITLLENRVKYGLFPDFFAHNLLLDASLEKDDFLSGARLSAVVMFQEEFGVNKITDYLSLYATLKYLESLTDFQDWKFEMQNSDLAAQLGPVSKQQSEEEDTETKAEAVDENEGEDDDEEDDADYIRVPWLKNPYFDDHFDLKNPRVICGKTMIAIGKSFSSKEGELGLKATLLGSVLRADWNSATSTLVECEKQKLELGDIKDVLQFYINNLHDVEELDKSAREALLASTKNIKPSTQKLSSLVESKCQFEDAEGKDLTEFKEKLQKWSETRYDIVRAREKNLEQQKLLQEIESKRRDLRRREEYLYFYDKMKKSNLNRIEYN